MRMNSVLSYHRQNNINVEMHFQKMGLHSFLVFCSPNFFLKFCIVVICEKPTLQVKDVYSVGV
jgi:hypothetical protein